MPSRSTTHLQYLLGKHYAGDLSARDELLEHSLERISMLARHIFHKRNDLRRIEETDDIVQKAVIRLRRALVSVRPVDLRAYLALAAKQVRWVLRDLASEAKRGRVVPLADHTTGTRSGADDVLDNGGEPYDHLAWAELHEKIEALPDEDREMFDVLLYDGLTQADAARLLGVSIRTVKRRWQRARLLLRDTMNGDWPSLG